MGMRREIALVIVAFAASLLITTRFLRRRRVNKAIDKLLDNPYRVHYRIPERRAAGEPATFD